MDARDALWDSARVRSLIAAKDIGGMIKFARHARGLRQGDLGRASGYSASTISRLENCRRASSDLPMVRRVAEAAGIPADVLGAALGFCGPASVTVATGQREEDPMRRRTFMAAAGFAVPAHMLASLDDALAVLPDPSAAPTADEVTAQLARARRLFDAGDLAPFIDRLPRLMSVTHANAEQAHDAAGYARLTLCYSLATEALNKLGTPASRITADRATAYATLSGSPIATAAAARSLSIVLRHEGRHAIANRVTLDAASRLEATGLATPAQAAAYAQMLCTCAYTTAQAGDRERALDMIADAEKAAARLPVRPGSPFSVTPASVGLYRVGIHWSLGDAGSALHVGRRLHPGQFPTAERRGRLHTDMARAWWQAGRPEETTRALLAAYREAPGEIRRPSIRELVTELAARHPKVTGVQRLAALGGQR
ncbi:Transcriptional regulator, contains XRE-family HTH domain [Streptosporangium subroseum]|uniref:Transcriptional regulator, contains XRE-family HTH domain n=1 Tax=Streptosporangium subroseum TaxID=106412 RepID=A0A239P1L6_9ACTN|nr:helix-turn-helix domain-containing protein [Streptosporangium subroseum]SNT60518.1 Transcriptional regulator, contains XRE-family HTH domain [Streptosporangium subroseum]